MKKVVALVLAMAMVIGTMAVSAFAADTYNVAGAAGLCGAEWDPSQNQMTDNGDGTYSLTFNGIAAGTYEFKAVLNGAWGTEYNLEGDASSGGGNASVTVDADNSTVVVSFDGEKALVAVNPEAQDNKAGDSMAVVVLLAVAALGVAATAATKKYAVER